MAEVSQAERDKLSQERQNQNNLAADRAREESAENAETGEGEQDVARLEAERSRRRVAQSDFEKSPKKDK